MFHYSIKNIDLEEFTVDGSNCSWVGIEPGLPF